MSPWLSDLFLSSQSDERLVALARAGHERAFVAIVERYGRELEALARRLDSSGRAEDLVQQTFLSAFAALRADSEVYHLRGWLYRILRHTAIRAAARDGHTAELDFPRTETETLETTVETRTLAREVLSELARLPSKQRDAIVAMSIAGRSRAEVARSMGVSEGAVRQLVHRARAALRTAVTAITPYPLAKLLSAARGAASPDGGTELAIGAATASAGGAAVKLGALVASGVVATGIVAAQHAGHHPARASSAPAGRVLTASGTVVPSLGASGRGTTVALVAQTGRASGTAIGAGRAVGAANASGRAPAAMGRGGSGGRPPSGGDGSHPGSSAGGGGGGPEGAGSGGHGARTSTGSGDGGGSPASPSSGASTASGGGGDSGGAGNPSAGSGSDAGPPSAGNSGSDAAKPNPADASILPAPPSGADGGHPNGE